MISIAPLALALSLAQAPAVPAPAAPQGAPAQAAPAPSAPSTLTLEDALRLTAERNYDIKAAAARLRQAEQQVWKAWSGYLPNVGASGTWLHNQYEAVLPAGSLGAGSPEITILAKDQLSGQIDVTQSLFSPALAFGIQAASRGSDVAELNTANFRRNVLFVTAQAYYAVASLRQAVQTAERLLEIQQRQEKDAKVRHQAGTIAKVALLRAEIDRARAEQDLIRVRNSYQSARIGLATLFDGAPDFEVVDPPDPTLPPDLRQLEVAALRDRFDVKAARRSVDAARSARNAVVGRYFPNLAAFGRWQIQNVAGFTGQDSQWSAGLALQWPIFEGGFREASLREANARIEEAEANVAGTETRVRADVQQAILDLESARANAQKAKEQRDLAAENQRLVDVSFRAGAATAVEQADATAQLRTAEIAQQTEALNAQLAAIRLLQVAGVTYQR
jgi:outer membrane protein TolC